MGVRLGGSYSSWRFTSAGRVTGSSAQRRSERRGHRFAASLRRLFSKVARSRAGGHSTRDQASLSRSRSLALPSLRDRELTSGGVGRASSPTPQAAPPVRPLSHVRVVPPEFDPRAGVHDAASPRALVAPEPGASGTPERGGR